MLAKPSRNAARPRRYGLLLVAALAGLATAALVSVAVARTFTLEVVKHAKVSDILNPSAMSRTENIAANSHGRAVYMLSGDSRRHPKCASTKCLGFWPPATVASGKKPSKSPGIRGKLGIWHRKGFNQVTLNGHPLYTFSGDMSKGSAGGDGIVSFGGTWHVIKASGSPSGTSSTGTGTTPTNPYGY